MNPNDQPVDLDAFLNAGMEDAVYSPPPRPRPESRFPTVPTPVPAKAPAQAPAKPKSLTTMGITKGGVVRNATTIARTQLENPVTNPKKPLPPVRSVANSPMDDLPPELGVPGTLMTSMDADLEKRAQERAASAMGNSQPVSALDSAYNKPPLTADRLTLDSSVRDLVSVARTNGGRLRLGTPEFILELRFTA